MTDSFTSNMHHKPKRLQSIWLASLPLIVLTGWHESAAYAQEQVATLGVKFQLVYDSLIRLTEIYFANIAATIASQVIILGWLVTSEKARSFLGTHRAVRLIGLATILLIAILDITSQVEAFKLSQMKTELLQKLGYIALSYFENDGISSRYFYINAGVHVTLFLALFTIVALTTNNRAKQD